MNLQLVMILCMLSVTRRFFIEEITVQACYLYPLLLKQWSLVWKNMRDIDSLNHWKNILFSVGTVIYSVPGSVPQANPDES